MFPAISTDLPTPTDPNWEEYLARLEKGNSFNVKVKEQIHAIYDAARTLGLKITHRDRGDYLRVWRVN